MSGVCKHETSCKTRSEWKISPDSRKDAFPIYRGEPWYEVLPAASSGFCMQFVHPIKADGVEHVALRPELFMTIAGKRIGAQQVMPIHLNFRGSRGNRHHRTKLAVMRRGRRYDDNFADFQHLGSNKTPSEIAQQDVALLGMVVERQSLNPIKAKPPEGGFNRHAAELASPCLRRWFYPEEEPDSCRLSPVTSKLWDRHVQISIEMVPIGSTRDERNKFSVPIAHAKTKRYSVPVAANSATGFGDPSNLAHKRPIRQQALFLCPQYRVMAAVRGIPSGMPGSKFPVRQPAHSCHPKSFGDDSWQLHTKLGATPVQTTCNPSKSHAAAWKARAFAALRADSSLSVRLRRYNEAMARARALEVAGGAK